MLTFYIYFFLVAVRQNKKFETISQASVEEIFKKWLRCARDRDGERNKRRE